MRIILFLPSVRTRIPKTGWCHHEAKKKDSSLSFILVGRSNFDACCSLGLLLLRNVSLTVFLINLSFRFPALLKKFNVGGVLKSR